MAAREPIPVVFVEPDGRRHEVQGERGRSLMQAAMDAGIAGIVAECGGCLTCATCHVIVAPAWAERLHPPESDEAAMLELVASPPEPTSRLSCQIQLEPALAGLEVRLPPAQY